MHRVLDPLWKTIPPQYSGKGKLEPHQLKSMMRRRVYRYLAAEMGISPDDCHTGMFTIEQCRQAYAILRKTTYTDVRRWVKEQQKREKA